jgi:hypothetical protein
LNNEANKNSNIPNSSESPDANGVFRIQVKKNNFCNWLSFMTSTTPLIHKSGNTTLKKYFLSFDKSSIFGVDCNLKLNNSYIHKTFYPSFSSINIELKTNPLHSENLNNVSNLNSTLDGSFLSYASEFESYSSKQKNSVFYYEDLAIHLRPLFCEKAIKFLTSNELDSISLSEVTDNSWFSVLWTPEKNKKDSYQEANAYFLVFYKIKPAAFDGKIGFLPVIGIQSGKLSDEIFWFSNQSSIQSLVNRGNLQKMKEDYYNNQIAFIQLMVNLLLEILDNFLFFN